MPQHQPPAKSSMFLTCILDFRHALSLYSGIVFLLPGLLQDEMDPIFEELPMVTVEVKGAE